jgi:hypothetical protein
MNVKIEKQWIEGQTMQWPKEQILKIQKAIYKTLHIKIKIEQYEPY